MLFEEDPAFRTGVQPVFDHTAAVRTLKRELELRSAVGTYLVHGSKAGAALRAKVLDLLLCLLQVHDELISVVPEDQIEEGMQIVKKAMYFDKLQVPLEVTAKAAYRWSEGK